MASQSKGLLNDRRFAIQRVQRAIAIRCHSANKVSECHSAALKNLSTQTVFRFPLFVFRFFSYLCTIKRARDEN
jgi:hypothetical protein